MRKMKTSERIDLLATVIGVVLTLAIGMGLSILLNDLVQGFLAMGILAIGLLAFLVRRDFISIGL
ncbi:MAG TPA: hypothetical protein VD761_06825 [Solirubrobacterales bacterium]|nr:hypothetical protein [Solirubrobacterales bacterium]